MRKLKEIFRLSQDRSYQSSRRVVPANGQAFEIDLQLSGNRDGLRDSLQRASLTLAMYREGFGEGVDERQQALCSPPITSAPAARFDRVSSLRCFSRSSR